MENLYTKVKNTVNIAIIKKLNFITYMRYDIKLPIVFFFCARKVTFELDAFINFRRMTDVQKKIVGYMSVCSFDSPSCVLSNDTICDFIRVAKVIQKSVHV